MTTAEIKQRWPAFYEVLEELAMDTESTFQKNIPIPAALQTKLDEYNAWLQNLEPAKRMTFAAGEQGTAAWLSEQDFEGSRPGVGKELHVWLDDDAMRDLFFE